MAAKWMCAGGGPQEPVRVVHGDGQVLSFNPPVKVGVVLVNHPHHYICHMSPELPSNRSPMLALDYELEPGYIYFLLPLPRLFPTSVSTPSTCCCHSMIHDREQGGAHGMNFSKGGFSPLRVKQIVMQRIGSPLRTAKKKVSPELVRCNGNNGNNSVYGGKLFGQENSPLLSPKYGGSSKKRNNKRCVSPRSSPNRLRENASARNPGSPDRRCGDVFGETMCTKWKPGLGCISETSSFSFACEELHQCLDRRRMTFDSKVRSGQSPLHLSDVFKTKSSSRDRDLNRSPKHMPLSGFIQI